MSAFPTKQPLDQSTCAPSLGIMATHFLQYILVPLSGSSRYPKDSQRHERCAYATHKKRVAHAGRNAPTPNRNLPRSNITCHSWCMQRHPLQQISSSQILLTNSQHTTSAPSQANPLLKRSPVLATLFRLYYPHLPSRHSPVNTQSYSCQIHCSL